MKKRCLLILIVPLLLGGGCARQTAKTPSVESLRQPPAPTTPQQAPEIPSEAQNVPRPY